MSLPIPMLTPSTKRRRRRPGSLLGKILGTSGVVLAIMLAIGFGVQQQADHQVVPPANHSQHH